MRGKYHDNRRKNILIALCLLVLTAVSVALISTATAKYVQTKKGDYHLVTPQGVVFSCDCKEGKTYIWVAESDFSFDVTTTSNIEYDVVCKTSDGGDVECSAGDPEETNNTITKTFKMAAANWMSGKEYTVTVTSASPYIETISFTVTAVSADEANYYTVTKHDLWLEVDLYIGSTPTDILIEYATLAPDNLNSLMGNWLKSTDGNAKTATIPEASLHAYSHYQLIFFGDMSQYIITPVAEKTRIDNNNRIFGFATPMSVAETTAAGNS